VRWELAIEAAEVGSFDWDLTTGRLSWDDTMLALFGYDVETFSENIEAFDDRVHPEDLPRVSRVLRDAIDAAGAFDVEYRILLPSGTTRWIQARGRVLADENGHAVRLMGAASDTTHLREGEAQVVRVLETMSAAFLALDRQWRLTYVNAEAERLLGIDREHLLGGLLWELFPATVGSEFETAYRRAMDSAQPVTVEAYYPAPVDAWFEVRASPVPEGLSLYFLDVTGRRAAQELVQLSARIGEQLSTSLDVEDAVRALARLVVPRLADWSVVSVVQADDTVRDLGCWHVEPATIPVIERFMSSRFDDREVTGAVGDARHLQAPVVIREKATELALATLKSVKAEQAIIELAPESAVVLPLVANDHVAGILTLCRGAARPPMSSEEIDVAIGVAGRAGMALDNARLYAEQRATAEQLRQANTRLRVAAEHDRTVARALQDAMLTRLPEPDHLHMVARYMTATGTEQVGGDWYDAVIQPDGATALVIGDVVGHDIAAAAMMGQLRNMLRAFAWARGDEPPSQIVARLDRAIRDLRLDTLCTLALVRVEQRRTDQLHGLRTLRWTNAGHPPPILLEADGTTTVLERNAETLLGVAPDTARNDHTHHAPPGSTLLLYTDGLIEARGHDIDDGQHRLADVLRRHRHLDPDDLLDAVLSDMVGDQPDDDVAVLAVRFHPEDRPRPSEAGPRHAVGGPAGGGSAGGAG
jgi:PAS domain S-box-containing protein